MPILNPNTLKVLVAPAFPLPYSLISIPLNNFDAIILNGIEPIRYAKIKKEILVAEIIVGENTIKVNYLKNRFLKLSTSSSEDKSY